MTLERNFKKNKGTFAKVTGGTTLNIQVISLGSDFVSSNIYTNWEREMMFPSFLPRPLVYLSIYLSIYHLSIYLSIYHLSIGVVKDIHLCYSI